MEIAYKVQVYYNGEGWLVNALTKDIHPAMLVAKYYINDGFTVRLIDPDGRDITRIIGQEQEGM